MVFHQSTVLNIVFNPNIEENLRESVLEHRARALIRAENPGRPVLPPRRDVSPCTTFSDDVFDRPKITPARAETNRER